MSSLIRILLINTHMKGDVELKLEGHSNICGTNASGKTTLQRLIPVFYGEYPSRVVPATRDSFERWYLPTDASYIIYEYRRPNGGLAQAVLTSAGEGKGVTYRFVDKGFELDDYIKQQDGNRVTCHSATELKRTFRQQGVDCSNAIGNVKDYRAIIQNDRSLINASDNGRELKALASQYALCEPGNTLRHIEKLVKAVHSKEGKMETIRQMVAAILEEDGVETPKTRVNPARVDEWIKESQLIAHFDGLRPQFAKLEQKFDTLKGCEIRLKALSANFSLEQSRLDAGIEEQERHRREALAQLEQANRLFEHQSSELKSERADAKADEQTLERRLNEIDEQHQQWLEKDIDAIKADLDRLGQWRDDLSDLLQRHRLLTEKHGDVEATFNRRRSQIEQRSGEAMDALRGRQDQARNEQTNLLRQQQEDMQALENDYRSQRQGTEQQFHQQQKQLELDIQKLQLQKDNASYSADERQQLDVLERRIDDAFAQLQQNERSLESARTEIQQGHKHRDHLQSELAELRRQVEQCQTQFDRIDALRFPTDNSLLKFLRQEREDWIEDIGKIIRPELLSRTDLKPLQLENGNNSLFGINLDLANIEAPEYAQDEQALKLQAEKARIELERAQISQQQHEQSIEKHRQQLQQMAEAEIQANTSYQTAKAQHSRLIDERRQQVEQFKAAIAERRLITEKRLKSTKQELDKLTSHFELELDTLKDQYRDNRMNKEIHWQDRLGQVEQQLDELKQDLSNRRSQKTEELAECDRWYQSELKALGIDDSQILALNQQIDALESKIRTTESQRDDVANYDIWFKGPFSLELPDKQGKLAKVQQEILELDRQLATLNREYKQQQQQFKAAQTDAEQALVKAREQLEHLTELARKITALKLKTKVEAIEVEAGTLDERLREARELLQQQDKLRSDIKSQVDSFDSLIGQKAGEKLAADWEQWRASCLVEDADGVSRIDHFKLVPQLQHLMNDLVPQKLVALRELGKNFGIDLNSYYRTLADIDRRISTQSNRITKEVGEELFLDGVSDSAVRIRSRIGELEFWDELKAFAAAFEKWRSNNFEGLPGDEYADLLRRSLQVIGRSALSGSIAKLLEIELRLTEGNSDLVIRTDRQLNESSSHGMAYLILCKFLLAFTRLLRGQSETIIHWPIDELGTLHHTNVKKIFDACENNGIAVLGAFPNPESEVLTLFQNRYIINKATKQLQVVQPKLNPIAERLSVRQAQQEDAV